ncbi:unnamed protein product [Rotaria sp. Silwood2]|nr:unnamed protein product [Rotaria sp. Silwood2]
MINNDETSDEHSIIITSQDSVFNDDKDQRLIKPRLTSIRYQFKNTVEKDLDNLFGKQGELFSTVLLTDVKSILTNLGTKLKSIAQDKTNINDYSTWFSLTFRQQHRILGTPSIREIEIPGQYTSKKKPLLEHHIKIVGFDEKILVLQSLRLPKRLTIRGHDENDYRFLVKGGEDIRQDQRIQALFLIMNDLYDNDPNCNQSNSAHITVQTYKVIPMSTKLGMIEWLDNTRPLKELIEASYTQAEHDIISQGQHPRKLYQDYVANVFQKSKPTAKSTSNTIMYAELFISLTKTQTNIRLAKENILSRDYNELASLCDDYLRRYENNEDENNLMHILFSGDNVNKIADIIVKSVLSSMKYGSNEGVKRFSRLLQIIELYPNTMESITNRLQEISCWMFFDCLYQITAYLDKPIDLKLYPLIEQIVKQYPQSIVYPFKLNYETLQYSTNDPILKHNLEIIRQKFDRHTSLVNEFIQALNQLNPQQEYENWCKELYQLLTNDHNLFGKQGELFSTVLLTDVKSILTNLGTKLKSIAHHKTNINDYSTWFSLTFRQQHRIISRKKPLLEHHIKIVGFDEKILVLQSLRLPKRITIREHDENDYRFLIKVSEDIRQDQRIQALFSIMNDLYDDDTNCNQSNSAHITVKTYKGMIEWLDNTPPLKELIETSYTQAELDIISEGQHPRKLYQDYVTNVFQKAKPTVKSTSNTIMYAELFINLTKSQVQDEFNKIQSVIPSDLLRRAYYKITNSHEGFYTLRRQFITSYAI